MPWLVASGVATVGLGALAIVGAKRGLGGGPYAHVLRGYTPIGIFLGVVAVVLSVLASAYAVRKRTLQERLSAARGPMTTWLWLHIAAGIVALAAVLLHAGMGAFSLELTSGKILLAIFVVIAVTGAAWRFAYAWLPPRLAPVLGNYARGASLARAELLGTEIDKALAGASPDLRRLADERASFDAGDASKLSVDERRRLEEIRELTQARDRALARGEAQGNAVRSLQAWRVAHVPLMFVLVPALVVHVIGAFDVQVTAVGVGDAPWRPLSGLHPSTGCASCHRAIVEQWSASMHAHALRSPITVAQNNQLLAGAYRSAESPDPKHLCVNCHGPVEVAATGRAHLPLHRGGYEDSFLDEGVGCSACHQSRSTESPGSAGLASFQQGLRPGSVQLGALGDAVGNAFHKSRSASVFTRDGALCTSCHDVVLDRNGDGRFDKGIDLVLQTTADEYAAYAARGNRPTCVGCHMPIAQGATRAAEAARIPTSQDVEAPPRAVHDHSFVGVDYPLDEVPAKDPQRSAREDLLHAAATLELDPPPVVKNGELVISVAITNSGVGHDLPSGFAFARQMWLEVRVFADDKPIFTSGVLAKPSDDLCDASTFDEPENPARRFMVGCTVSEKELVSFQQKLLDHVEVDRDRGGSPRLDPRGATRAIAAKGAKETWLQELTAGVVPRVRPVDGAVLTPIAPEETRRFVYRVPLRGARSFSASARLLFRSLAPYMVRALAAGQAPDDVRLDGLADRLQVVEMAARSIVSSR